VPHAKATAFLLVTPTCGSDLRKLGAALALRCQSVNNHDREAIRPHL
jgi:hypothetical protein